MEKTEKKLDIIMALLVNKYIDEMPNFINGLKEIRKKYSFKDFERVYGGFDFGYDDNDEIIINDSSLCTMYDKTCSDLVDFIRTYYLFLEESPFNYHSIRFESLMDIKCNYLEKVEEYIKYVYEVAGVENVPRINDVLGKMKSLGITTIKLQLNDSLTYRLKINAVDYGAQTFTNFDYTDGKIGDLESTKESDNQKTYMYNCENANFVIKNLSAKAFQGVYQDYVGYYEFDSDEDESYDYSSSEVVVNNLIFDSELLPNRLTVNDTLFAIYPMLKNQNDINRIIKNLEDSSSSMDITYESSKALIDLLNKRKLTKNQKDVIIKEIDSIRLGYLNTLKMIYSSMDLPGEDIASLVFKDDGK